MPAWCGRWTMRRSRLSPANGLRLRGLRARVRARWSICIGCLDRPTEGELKIDGVDVATMSATELDRFRADKIGFIFQQFHLIPYLSALENVMLAQYFHSMTDEAEARAALERVGLGQRAEHLPSELSGGEQQRVCIARALINNPPILLADEPTGNLDAANQKIVAELLQDLHAHGHTIVMVTHDPEMAALAQTEDCAEPWQGLLPSGGWADGYAGA